MKTPSITRISYLVISILMLGPSPTFAAPVTIDGSLFNSEFNVTYDDELSLLGTPVLSNNTISFSPEGMTAHAISDSRTLLSSSLDLKLTPHANFSLTSLIARKEGTYQLSGVGGFVHAGGTLTAREADQPIEGAARVVLSEIGEIHDLLDDFDQSPFPGRRSWSSGGFIDDSIPGWSPEHDMPLIVSLSNFMEARVQGGPGAAFIEEDLVRINVDTFTFIPLPAALPLFASGLFLLGFMRKTRSAKNI